MDNCWRVDDLMMKGERMLVHAPVCGSSWPDVGDDEGPRLGRVGGGAAPHREAKAVLLLLQQDAYRASHHAAAALHSCGPKKIHT